MNFSTDPPSASISSCIDRKYEPVISFSVSGSKRWPRPVEPVMSAKRIVTSLSSSPVSPTSGVAHCEQKRAPSSFGAPHEGQVRILGEVYDLRRGCPREERSDEVLRE